MRPPCWNLFKVIFFFLFFFGTRSSMNVGEFKNATLASRQTETMAIIDRISTSIDHDHFESSRRQPDVLPSFTGFFISICFSDAFSLSVPLQRRFNNRFIFGFCFFFLRAIDFIDALKGNSVKKNRVLHGFS